jgi:hypothetical protein
LVRARDAGDFDLDDVRLVVVGAPTHERGLSREHTRDSAVLDAGRHPDCLLDSTSPGPGVREWLHGLPLHHSCRGVAFDTRLDHPSTASRSAARAIERGLHDAGFVAFGAPHSFVVTGTAGPLAFGEIERAREWGEAMGHMIVGLDVVYSVVSRGEATTRPAARRVMSVTQR